MLAHNPDYRAPSRSSRLLQSICLSAERTLVVQQGSLGSPWASSRNGLRSTVPREARWEPRRAGGLYSNCARRFQIDDSAPRYLLLDRDTKYEGAATEVLKCMGSKLIRAAYRSPWQNGAAERWVGSRRRELLDHVIVFNEAHLRHAG